MIRSLSAFALLSIPAAAFTVDKPREIDPKNAANGTLMMFDGVTPFGWEIKGDVSIHDGWMIVGGEKPTTITCNTAFPTKFVVFQIEYDKTLADEKQPRLTLNEKHKDQIPIHGLGAYATDSSVSTRVRLSVPAGTKVKVGDVLMSPETKVKLFSGKSLDGWKINAADPKRMSSKWSVTADRELSLKSGPGDLVTEQEFANFVLRLDCKTLGKSLNSGVFFRCIPGQYQNGYEAQIHNGFKSDDRTKPTDYGTGAIYRRTPARKVVSNDNEWFTMTIVADGKHIATWVNGYQTIDWTDDRKENDNPRLGYRAAKGPISLQGHDPTTDILFRNIGIVELPK
jgi:hypothetical protein